MGQYAGLALDLDDTLLGPDRKLGGLASLAVQQAHQLGVTVIVATGRDRSSAKGVADQLNMRSPVIANSGAVVVDADDRPLRVLTLGGEIYQMIMSKAADSYLLYVYSNRGILTNRSHPRTKRYSEILGVDIEVKPWLIRSGSWVNDWDIYGVSIRTEPQQASRLGEFWERQLIRRAEVVHSVPGLVEILPLGASKGEGLDLVSSYLDIPLSNWVAVGDSRGDISMIERAGCGVLVANAPQKLHHSADWVTDKPYTHGVMEVINRFWDSHSSAQSHS